MFQAGVIRRVLLEGVDGASVWHLKGHAYGIIEADNAIRPTAHLFMWAARFLSGKMMQASSPEPLEVIAILRPDGGRSLLIGNKANHTVELGSLADLGLTHPVAIRQVNARGNFEGTAPPVLSLPGYSLTLLTTPK